MITAKHTKAGATTQTLQNIVLTINFAHLKSRLVFRLDTIALLICDPHMSLHAVRTAAAFQEASDAYHKKRCFACNILSLSRHRKVNKESIKIHHK